ncbi:MAG: helix-turn-helix transcriptional regulator [Gemmatimonadaceae bacterium]|nr:helix-turn-helix transcriptional regulator [Gemmatimonadaceae bacterium]
MVKYVQVRLDTSFAALSGRHPTRRSGAARRSDASITDLARKFHITLAGMKKHVGVLEQAGLVTTEKVARVPNCTLGAHTLQQEPASLPRHRQLWDARFDELDHVVEELNRKERIDGRKNRK